MMAFIFTLLLSHPAIAWVIMEFTDAQVHNLPAVLALMMVVSIINAGFFPTIAYYQFDPKNKWWLLCLLLLNACFFCATATTSIFLAIEHFWHLPIASSVYTIIIYWLFLIFNLKENPFREVYSWGKQVLMSAKRWQRKEA